MLLQKLKFACTVKNSFKTKTIKDDLNPKWNEGWILKISESHKHKLLFEVYDEDRVKDDFLGCFKIKLSDVPTETDGATLPKVSFSEETSF